MERPLAYLLRHDQFSQSMDTSKILRQFWLLNKSTAECFIVKLYCGFVNFSELLLPNKSMSKTQEVYLGYIPDFDNFNF